MEILLLGFAGRKRLMYFKMAVLRHVQKYALKIKIKLKYAYVCFLLKRKQPHNTVQISFILLKYFIIVLQGYKRRK